MTDRQHRQTDVLRDLRFRVAFLTTMFGLLALYSLVV